MSNELRAEIIRQHGKQWRFAKALGIGEDRLSRAVNRGQATDELKEKIAKKLGRKVEELFAE